MNKILLVYFFCTGLLLSPANGQNSSEKISRQVEQYHETFPWEKIYLHTDKPHYTLNDTIWIKAYGLLERGSELPKATPSVPLYVDLIDVTNKKSVEQIIVKLDQGLGQADIVLPADIKPGIYTLRAQTQWMRNFGKEAFFHKDIWIGELNEVMFPVKQPDQSFTLGFYPEGGSLVYGLTSKIGFKATGEDGLGTEVIGYLLNSKKDTILRFESSHLGMGSFSFKPTPDEQYTTLVKSSETAWESKDFPEIMEDGILLKIDPISSEEEVSLQIHHNLDAPPENIYLVGISKGKTVYQNVLNLEDKPTIITLAKDKFYPGITQFTLFDLDKGPLAERLVYFHPFAQGNARFTTDQEVYKPKDMVKMEIEVLDEFGVPVEGDFSLSVTDAFQVNHQPHSTNIVSHFQLNSELKGQIEQPFYYFDPENENAEKHLDNLVLTQGWRRFTWDILSASHKEPGYPFEKGLSISGTVSALGKRNNEELQLLTMVVSSLYDMPQVLEGSTDEFGKFNFENLNFQDSVGIFLQAFTEQEKKSGETRQIKFNEVKFHTLERPEISDRLVTDIPIPEKFRDHEDYLVEVGKARDIMQQFVLSQEVELAEVTVKGSRSDRLVDPRTIQYGDTPESQLIVTPEMYYKQNIYQLIQGRFPGVEVKGDVFNYANLPTVLMRNGVISGPDSGSPVIGGASFFVDGVPVNPYTAANLLVIDIERVDVLISLSRTAMFGEQGKGGVINILTKRGNPSGINFVSDPRLGLGNAALLTKGYAPQREFYTPPQKADPGAPIAIDYRSTIFWQPRLTTGEDGKAWVEFLLTDGNPEVLVDLQGLSALGEPIRVVYNFKVQ
ncbi:Plug domain-containing protein [Cyclobacteriaceae bacterium YHN15]|nr:Plug domain-containing protein [Cyclobacteriaceae bacterium YHN15]